MGAVTTLGNYHACISKLFSVSFNVSPTDSARVKAVMDNYGKDHPAQPRWSLDQTWDPGCIVFYWSQQPDNADPDNADPMKAGSNLGPWLHRRLLG